MATISSVAIRREAAQMLTDAISARNTTKPTDAIMSTGFAPSISVSRKRLVNRAPAIPGIGSSRDHQQALPQ